MPELIVIDDETQRELGRRQMSPDERYQLYRDCSERALLLFEGRLYTMHQVKWQMPEQTCLIRVTYRSMAYVED